MMNSKNKFSVVIVAILFVNTLLFSSCNDKDSGKDISFDLSLVETDTITIDSIVDSTNTNGDFYKIALSINNNYFRLACEENSIYLDDVQSVTLKSSEVEYVSAGGNLSSFKNISQYAHDNGLASTDLMASAESITGNPVSLTLTPTSNNLQKYFRLIYTPVEVYLGREDAGFTGADVKFKFVFTVKGKTH